MPVVHVFDFAKAAVPPAPVAALFGNVPLLKTLARQHLQSAWGEDADVTTIDGEKKAGAEWRDARDELATRSLFGGGKRVVWVRDADDFVSAFRKELEKYASSPLDSGALVLDLAAFAGNTKLYKSFVEVGVVVDCRAPQVKRGSGKAIPDTQRIAQWLCERAEDAHECKLELTGAQAMLELIGIEFGLLDQELARLALFAEPGATMSAKDVRKNCGGWRSQTTWDLIDAMLAGETANALQQLDQLLRAGESPFALFGQISWSLRRFAIATRIVMIGPRQRRRVTVKDALKQAGFQPFIMDTAEKQLKHMGPGRAMALLDLLMETDLALKGSHSTPTRSRHALEQLLIRMSQPREDAKS